MTTTVEITKGKPAARFRAYVATKALRKPRLEDHKKMAAKGKAFTPGQRIKYTVHEATIRGSVSGTSLTIDAKDALVHKIVFYAGPEDAEEVVGSLEVNASGKIELELVEREEAENISEADLAGG